MDADDGRWQRVDALFEAALDRPRAERSAFLDAECPDPDLRRRVEKLLRAEASSAPFLERRSAVARALTGALREQRKEQADPLQDAYRPGDRIGPWRVVEHIGRGGMATVYGAERAEGGFEQRVAVKVIRRGLDTADVVRRFRAERDILSSLQHPHIARLLDGGATGDGRPYLVMERVDGTPLVEWCDRRDASVQERLRLFLDVCDAVGYAHRNLVVHRDLKPSNILVTDEGRVMLLDFGIAKLLRPGGVEEVAPDEGRSPIGGGARPDRSGRPDHRDLTRTGHVVLTPGWASPEQVLGEPVTTSTDVWQLGVLLYRLLSGAHPWAEGAMGVEAAVSGGAPSRPSEAGGGREVRGDLDTIVLEALRREPERRYASVEAMAEDVRRHLAGRPIAARPDTWLYRTMKLLRRNRWILPVASALLLAVGGYVLTLMLHSAELERERDRARLETERAEEVRDFLVGLFQSADPFAPRPGQGAGVTVAEALEGGLERARNELRDRPALHADLLGTVSEVFARLDETGRAQVLRNEALEIERRVHGPRSTEVMASLAALGRTTGRAGDTDSAAILFGRALELAEEVHGSGHPVAGVILADRGRLAHRAGRARDAEADLARAAALLAPAGPDFAADRAAALVGLSGVRRELGDADGAEAAALEAFAAAAAGPGADDLQTLELVILPLLEPARLHLEAGRLETARAAAAEIGRTLREGLPEGRGAGAVGAAVEVGAAAAGCREGRALAELGRSTEAARRLENAVEVLLALESGSGVGEVAAECVEALAGIMEGRGEADRAASLRARLAAWGPG